MAEGPWSSTLEDKMDWIMSRALLLPLILLCLFSGEGSADKAEALFVFGDSAADTGNRNPYNISLNKTWRPPYGMTWPGFPAGRFSSGKIQTDFWAELLGLPPPTPYELLKIHDCKINDQMIRSGVNFAVGGSGITRAYGFITVPQQLKQFKKLLAGSRAFDFHKLSRSVVLISVVANDYGSFVKSRNGSTKGLPSLVKPVVSGIVEVVKQLYDYGLRNFVVSGMAPLGCLPEKVKKMSCDSKYDKTVELHNILLKESIKELQSSSKGLSFIIPDMVSAFNHIFSNPEHYGFVDLFVPCCAGKRGRNCGETDKEGRPLFEVCENVNNKLFWDSHPTHRGWYTIMSLYSYGAGEAKNSSFIAGTSNTVEWLHSLGLHAHKISPDV